MAKLKFKFEILISGIYPFNDKFEKLGFELITKKLDEDKTTNILNEELIYISPLLGMCCYPDAEGNNIYLTFDKEEYREIVEYEDFEDKKKIVDQYLSSIDIFEDANKLKKIMILNTNNNIKFPIKMVKVYDENEKLITFKGYFMKLNIPCLIGSDQEYFANVISRQNNRLSSNVSYEKISELMANNKNFSTAMSLYYSSFSITEISVSFIFLNSSLDSLLSYSTYEKPRKRKGHKQSKQGIKESIAENANALLMCVDEAVKEKIRNYYKYRNKFVHAGISVKIEDM